MPDFGFYSSLQASPHFDTMRRDAMQNIMLATRMRDDAVAQNQERLKAMQAVTEQLNASEDSAATMLGPDAERLRSKEMDLRKKYIIDSLQQHNNDPVMFRMSGGDAALSKYHRELIGSDEFRNGLENQKNYQLGVDATRKGEMIDPVEIQFDGGTKQKVDWHDAVDLYQQGVIKKLPFKSSMPMAQLDPMKFLSHELPDADLKHKGYVGVDYVADIIQAENPRYSREQALNQAHLFDNKDVPGATHFIWGRRLPHTSGSGGVGYFNAMNKIMGVKSTVDNLHRALVDPSMKGAYNADVNGYEIKGSPFDISKIKESSAAHAAPADGLYVRNDPTDPNKNRFIVHFQTGGTKEMTVDDVMQWFPDVNMSDYTALMKSINGGNNALYNASNYAAVSPDIPFTYSKSTPGSAPPDFIANDPKLLAEWNKKHSEERVDFNYNKSADKLEDVPGW